MAGRSDESDRLPRNGGILRRRWPWLCLFVAAAVFLAWLEPDEGDLFELCRSQGRPEIYRSVSADGYFFGAGDDCWGCWNYLENTGYTFIEFPISHPRAWGPINEPGIYRVSRIPADSPQCDEKLTAFYQKAAALRAEMERHNWCFGLEKSDRRRARYGYYQGGLAVVARSAITGSSISASRVYFLDHENGEILAESTDYALAKYPFFQVSSFSSPRVCNDFIDRLGVRGLDRQDVIKPHTERRQ